MTSEEHQAYREQADARRGLRDARAFLNNREIEQRRTIRNHDYLIANHWMDEASYTSSIFYGGQEIAQYTVKVVAAESRLAAANATLKAMRKAAKAA